MTDADDMREAAAALFHPGEPSKPTATHEEQLREATHNLFKTEGATQSAPVPKPTHVSGATAKPVGGRSLEAVEPRAVVDKLFSANRYY